MEAGVGRATLSVPDAERLVRLFDQRSRVTAIEHLADGIANTSFRLQLASGDSLVLRSYRRDPAACAKEVALHALVRGTVPVPEIVYAAPNGIDGDGPFALLRFVEGITLGTLKRTGDAAAVADAARSAGETLAAIGRFAFPRAGWLASTNGDLSVAGPLMQDEGGDVLPRFVEQCLAAPTAGQRLGTQRRERVSRFMWSWAPRLTELEAERQLVHCDYGNRNLIVRQSAAGWRVAAVLDWEFAVAASPLIDVGHFLRYDRAGRPRVEPHFSRGFVQAGGTLPDDWRRLARAIDLSALIELLGRERTPESLLPELLELVDATLEERDATL